MQRQDVQPQSKKERHFIVEGEREKAGEIRKDSQGHEHRTL